MHIRRHPATLDRIVTLTRDRVDVGDTTTNQAYAATRSHEDHN